MTELYLLRHAKAVAQDDASSDRERPLEERGRKAARAIAQWMVRREAIPDFVLCSPALRTRQTLEAMATEFPRRLDTGFENEIYLADASQLLKRLRDIPLKVERLLLVGHNPGIYELAQSLMDTSTGPLAQRLATGFPTAALARFEPLVGWPALGRRTARLVSFVTPKDL